MSDESVIIRGWRGKEYVIDGVTKDDLQKGLFVLRKVHDGLKKAHVEAIDKFRETYPNKEEQRKVEEEKPEDYPWKQPLYQLYWTLWHAKKGSQALEELLGLDVEDW